METSKSNANLFNNINCSIMLRNDQLNWSTKLEALTGNACHLQFSHEQLPMSDYDQTNNIAGENSLLLPARLSKNYNSNNNEDEKCAEKSNSEKPNSDNRQPELYMRDVDIMISKALQPSQQQSSDSFDNFICNNKTTTCRLGLIPPPKETLFFIGGTNGAHL